MRRFILLVILLGISFTKLTAQFVYENRVYSPIVKTVTLRKSNELFSQPVIKLNSGDKLLLEFDELREDTRRYEYTLIHCNNDWTQSPLSTDQYLEGFDIQPIENFENSFNTIQRYVHYSQTIPSDEMRIIRSGNYIVKVFAEGNPDNVILTRRMYVVDDRTDIELDIHSSTNAALYKTHQEVNVKVGGKDGAFFVNPEQYMNVYVMQNSNDLTVHKLKIRGMSGSKIDFSFDNANQFEAGNEFRYFDFTSMRRKSQYVADFDYLDNQNHVYLRPIQLRPYGEHASDKDLDGGFYVRNEYSENNSTTSDYAWVHFVLSSDINLEGDYYIVGAMNDWKISAQNKMDFNGSKYEKALYLKQGYYNYTIAFSTAGRTNTPYTSYITDGSFYQTENNYSVFVYYHNFSDNCDELIGYYSLTFRP